MGLGRHRRHTFSVELVATLLDYSPADGKLYWAKDWYGGKKGEEVYFNKRGGHYRIEIAGRLRSYARVCWMRHFLEDPHPLVIDHKNGDPTNNRIENLRLATAADNARNHRQQRNNTSGKSGVTFKRTGRGLKRWRVRINDGSGKRRLVGDFLTKEEAIEARLKAEEAYGQFRPREAA